MDGYLTAPILRAPAVLIREWIQRQALPKSWHCQNWLTPSPPLFGTLVNIFWGSKVILEEMLNN